MKDKILIVGEGVICPSTFDLLQKELKIIKITPHELTVKAIDFNEVIAIWIHFDTFLDRNWLKKISQVPFLISTTTGLTHISRDIQEYYGKNLISLRGQTDLLLKVTSTAEHAWLFLMLWNSRLESALLKVKNGIWSREKLFRKQQIAGKTLGIIGYGRLGKIFAKFGQAFNMKILVYEIEQKAILDAKESNYEIVESVNDLFVKSDVVSIHASYSVGDSPIITDKVLSSINKPFLLINTARAGLVCESSIIQEITNRPYLHYYSDVLKFEEEGNSLESSNLWQLFKSTNRIRITPHIGGANLEAALICEQALVRIFFKKLKTFRESEPN